MFSTVACNVTPAHHLWYVNYFTPFPHNVSLDHLWVDQYSSVKTKKTNLVVVVHFDERNILHGRSEIQVTFPQVRVQVTTVEINEQH